MSPKDPATAEGIVRRIPWKAMVVVALLAGVGALGYLAVENRQTEGLRRSLLGQQETLAVQGGPPFAGLRQRVAGLLKAEAAATYPGDQHQDGFDPRSFKDEVGLYLRLPLKATTQQPAQLEELAQRQPKDALAGCLGLTPVRWGAVLKEGWFLSPEYRQGLRDAPNHTRLQALGEDFKVRVGRDLQPLAGHLRPDYLLLVLDEEPQAERQFFRIVFYDLRPEQAVVLARARTQSAYHLVPVRWLPKADRRPKEPEGDAQAKNTAADCAVAAAIKPAGTVEEQPPAAPGEGAGTSL